MARAEVLTTDRAQYLFAYDSATGCLSWREKRGNRVPAGSVVQGYAPDGRRYVRIDGNLYAVHMVVWIWHGRELTSEIDHRNNDHSDNRIENLRLATSSQNKYNCRLRKDNRLGIKNVCPSPRGGYKIQLSFECRRVVDLRCQDLELAELIAAEARDKYHGAFARNA